MHETPPPTQERQADVAEQDSSTEGQHGQGMVEYMVIVMLVAVLLILAVQVLGHQTNNLYSNINHAFP